MTYTRRRRIPPFSYNPEAAEPPDTQYTDEQWANGKLACSWCNEIIPGGEIYFDIPGQGVLCESCARDKFCREAPYYDDDE